MGVLSVLPSFDAILGLCALLGIMAGSVLFGAYAYDFGKRYRLF